MQDLVSFIVKSLVSKTEGVVISEEVSDNVINVKLKVDPADMGVVIGKSGQTIRAIRRLLMARALAENRNLKVFLNLEEGS